MTTEKSDDFYELTFSQREEKVPLPEGMKLEHIPKRFRQLAWLSIDSAIRAEAHNRVIDDSYWKKEITGIVWSYQFDILSKPHDEIPYLDPSKDREISRNIIILRDYHEVLTFIEHILRHEKCPKNLYTSLTDSFDKSSIAYFVKEINGMPTVVPRISREAGDSIKQSIETLHEGGMDSAATHLRQAAEHMNAQQYADSIADSIHAVESIARAIDPRANRTLGPALKSLEKAGMLKHPALKEAFAKLYGYTNDEQGIRHALTDKDAADVGLDEAVFMFGACASFAAYLTAKHRQADGA